MLLLITLVICYIFRDFKQNKITDNLVLSKTRPAVDITFYTDNFEKLGIEVPRNAMIGILKTSNDLVFYRLNNKIILKEFDDFENAAKYNNPSLIKYLFIPEKMKKGKFKFKSEGLCLGSDGTASLHMEPCKNHSAVFKLHETVQTMKRRQKGELKKLKVEVGMLAKDLKKQKKALQTEQAELLEASSLLEKEKEEKEEKEQVSSDTQSTEDTRESLQKLIAALNKTKQVQSKAQIHAQSLQMPSAYKQASSPYTAQIQQQSPLQNLQQWPVVPGGNWPMAGGIYPQIQSNANPNVMIPPSQWPFPGQRNPVYPGPMQPNAKIADEQQEKLIETLLLLGKENDALLLKLLDEEPDKSGTKLNKITKFLILKKLLEQKKTQEAELGLPAVDTDRAMKLYLLEHDLNEMKNKKVVDEAIKKHEKNKPKKQEKGGLFGKLFSMTPQGQAANAAMSAAED